MVDRADRDPPYASWMLRRAACQRAPPEHDFPKSTQTFFVRENGIDLAITNAIEAIVSCLRSEEQFCVNVPDEGMNLRSLGM